MKPLHLRSQVCVCVLACVCLRVRVRVLACACVLNRSTELRLNLLSQGDARFDDTLEKVKRALAKMKADVV